MLDYWLEPEAHDYTLDEDYSLWLAENCRCDLENEGCSCIDFDEWHEERKNAYKNTGD